MVKKTDHKERVFKIGGILSSGTILDQSLNQSVDTGFEKALFKI